MSTHQYHSEHCFKVELKTKYCTNKIWISIWTLV